MQDWKLKSLPLTIDVETKKVLKQLVKSHAALAELKGVAETIPNQKVLLNTLILREAKESSAVENIITSHDELYKSQIRLRGFISGANKEVQNYVSAMNIGYRLITDQKILTNSTIKKIQQTLEGNNAGFRKQSGTVLRNDRTQEVVYTPPQRISHIEELMINLEWYTNDSNDELDPLIKMAIIHHQFESIHPFYDGNGRTGRIINILYLIIKKLQVLPVLYLSSYIIKNKQAYYELLQGVRDRGDWEAWILYIIKGVEETALDTIRLINEIKILMQNLKYSVRGNYKFYSQDLINHLCSHPYTKIELLVEELGISRITAANYLNQLAMDCILDKHHIGRANYYVNKELYLKLSAS
ncbi:MAG: Fic family protein [Croceivirga sp.]